MTRMALYTVMIVALLAGGCGRHEDAGGAQGEKTGFASQPVQEAARTSSTGRVARVVEKHLDASLKVMDDFSAALGLQYARISYDTNRYLFAYTNVVTTLSDAEFGDFVRDFLRARRNECDTDELQLLRGLVRERFAQILTRYHAKDHNMVQHLSDCLNCTYAQQRNAGGLIANLEEQIQQVSARLPAEEQAPIIADLVRDTVLYLPSSVPGPADHNGMLSVVERLLDDSRYTGYDKIKLREAHAGLVYLVDPDRALEEYTKLVEEWPVEFRNKRQYVYTRCVKEGLAQGLRGDELANYALKRYRAER